MAPLPTVSDVVRVRLIFTIQGKTGQGLRFFVGYTGTPPSNAACLSFADSIGTSFVTNLNGMMNSNNTLTNVIVEDLSSYTGGVGEGTNDEPGTRSGTSIPPDACMVASYEISRRYRGGHPRSYWPFGMSDDLDGSTGTWSSTFVGDVNSALETFYASITGLSSGGCTLADLVNVSYYDGFTAVENPLTGRYRNVPKLRDTPVVDSILSTEARSYVGSMRKRRFKPD